MVRHGERLDEADDVAWEHVMAADKSGRDKHSIAQDPPLTLSGQEMAANAVIALHHIISDDIIFSKIYCSRMRRCISTAIPFALAYNAPIYLSKEISLSAVGVMKSVVNKGYYDYCSIEEIRSFSPPTVVFIEMPSSIPSMPPHHHTDSHTAGRPPDWRQTIYDICETDESSLVIAHRETIRDFIHEPVNKVKIMPYCSVAKFSYQATPRKSLHLKALVDSYGNDINFN
jgi:hypothetical protein